ncbi:MAG: recombinase family protein [Deltaproteobacteria bacterium]|nr:recombinase family protein [Deltaproteobacteria bacterium]
MFDGQPTINLRLIGLARVSGIGQAADDRLGLPRQIASLEAIANQHKASLQVVQIANVSGSDVGETPEWRDVILPALRSGAHLAVDSIDRLSRASGLDLSVLRDVAAAGARIYSPGQVRDLGNTDDALVTSLLALLAGREKKEIVRRAAAAKEAGRKAGRWVCGAPTPRGTTFDGKWGYSEDVDTVRHIFRAYADGASVADLVRQTGWSRQTVGGVLDHDIYSGWLVYDHRCDGEYVAGADGRQGHRKPRKRKADEVIRTQVYGLPGQEEPIVSEALWATVRARRTASAKRHTRSARETSQHGWFSGLVEVHGAPDVQGEDLGNGFRLLGLESTRHRLYVSKATDGYRYRCVCCDPKIKKEIGRCKIGCPTADQINVGIDNYLARLTGSSEFLDVLKATLSAEGNDTKSRDAIRASLHTRKQKAESKRSRLLDLYLDGNLEKTIYTGKVTEIDAEVASIQAEIAKLDDAPLMPSAADINTLASTWTYDPNWSLDRKRDWIRRYLANVTISRENVEHVTLRIPAADGSVTFTGGIGSVSWADLLPAQPVRYTTSQVAEQLGMPLWQLNRAMQRCEIARPAEKCGRLYRWTPEEVDAAKTGVGFPAR